MILIVGLGNPGEKYQNTRHNLGFMVVDELAKKLLPLEKTSWRSDRKSNSFILKVNKGLILAKPQTFMNASGRAVSAISRYYNISISDIWVIHDDLDLPLGKLKVRKGGSSAGHRGVESIISELGTEDFIRFRLGISHPKGRITIKEQKLSNVEGYVLSSFDSKEYTVAKRMVKQTVKGIQLALEKCLNHV